MSLVKINAEFSKEILNEPFSVRFQREIELKPFSTVELVNLSCGLKTEYIVRPTTTDNNGVITVNPMTIEIYDRHGAASLGVANVQNLTEEMTREDFLLEVQNTLNGIFNGITWEITQGNRTVYDDVVINWESTNFADYNLRLIISTNYFILGFSSSIIDDDLDVEKETGIMSAPYNMLVYTEFDQDMTLEILNYSLYSFDSATNQRGQIVYYINGVDTYRDNNLGIYRIDISPPYPLKIKLNNETKLNITELTFRLMTDEKQPNGKFIKRYTNIKSHCNFTLSFGDPKDN